MASSSQVSSNLFVSSLTINGRTVSNRRSETRTTADDHERKLTAGEIVGDDIDLEATETRRVEGKRVRLGPGCVIDEVRYRESLDVDPEAPVKQTVKG
jgi:hypothetical protein